MSHCKLDKNGGKRYFWSCECECGKRWAVRQDLLLRKKKKLQSCGCQKLVLTGENNHAWKGYKDIPLQFWNRIKRDARKRGLDFGVSIEEAWELFLKQEKRCALTGDILTFATFTQCHKNKKSHTASLDRIDSSKDYTISNIQWVHKHVNMIKSTLTNEQFIQLCEKVVQNKERLC